MYPNNAALGDSGTVRRAGLFFLLPIIALATIATGCKNPADPQGPVDPPPIGFTLRGVVTETAAEGNSAIGAVLVEVTSGSSVGTSTTTDALGRFTLLGLSGQLNLRFSREGFVPTGRTVDMSEDMFLTVTLEREDPDTPPDPGPTFTLSGIVSRGQGDMDPIGGATVEVLDGPRAGDAATTDALGRFSLPDLSGEVTVRASRDGFDPEEKTVEMTEDMMVFFHLVTPPLVSMCLDLDDEEVHITNDDMFNELILTDWVLREVDASNQFTFVQDIECRPSMSGFILDPGATVIITAGENPQHTPPTHIAGWCDGVWDNDGDIARLFKPNGDLFVEAVGSFAACGG